MNNTTIIILSVFLILIIGCNNNSPKQKPTDSGVTTNPILQKQIEQNTTSQPEKNIEENLDWQCPYCPSPCRDKNDQPIWYDIDENGSCICVKENDKCVRKIKKFIINAPEIKPESFLGPHINKESSSDWMNYEPLKQKVKELTKGLTTDKEKAYAIASWVKNSKAYSPEAIGRNVFTGEDTKRISPANAESTIIDIFESKQGVCLDAAYLTAAMLRIANIPSMAVQPNSDGLAHQVTYAFFDGKWHQVDSTFGIGDPSVGIIVDPQDVTFSDYNDLIGGAFEIATTFSYFCSHSYNEKTAFQEYNYYLEHLVTLNKYGKTCLPFFSGYLQYWDNGYLSPNSEEGKYKWVSVPRISISDSHYNLKYNWVFYSIPNETICDDVRDVADYLYCMPLPIGKYHIDYKKEHIKNDRTSELIDIANLDFEIKADQSLEISKNDFVKNPSSPPDMYDSFIKYVDKILSYQNN